MIWKKILFIFNPVAGRSLIRNNLCEIIEVLSGSGFEVVCYPTRAKGDARRVARERMGDYLYVVCAGGDGTLDEVVSGMMENPDKPFVPIGYIPAGTTNDFANSLQIPTDLIQAAEVVTTGRTFRCDMGLFNDSDYFTYVAAFGLFTGTSYQTPQDLKNQLGHFAYILQGLTELGQMRAYRMHVTAVRPDKKQLDTKQRNTKTDQENTVQGTAMRDLAGQESDEQETAGQEPDLIEVDGEFAYGMVTNSYSIGGFPNITGNHVDLQDGLFEVTLIHMPQNPLEVSEILLTLSNPEAESSMIETFKTSHVTLTCDEQVSWTRDGEFAGSHKTVEIRIRNRQLRILVPRTFADPVESSSLF